jgi:uncharacterized protein (TIGR02246 family)
MTLATRKVSTLLACTCALAACAQRAAPERDTQADVAAINALLEKVEQTFSTADLDGAMTVFTPDAAIMSEGTPDISGIDAIRTMYAGMMQQVKIDADLRTMEIEIAGDLAYERGTYTLRLTDKASGQLVLDTENRHLHILRRQPDGSWKTWRMFVNSAAPPPAAAGTP